MKPMTAIVAGGALLSVLAVAETVSISNAGRYVVASNPVEIASLNRNATVDVAPAKRTIPAPYFVTKVATSAMFEVEASRLAEEKGEQIDKTVARRTATEQRKAASELKSMVDGGVVSMKMPVVLDSDHQEMLAELKQLHGKAFDSAYEKGQVSAQRELVALFEQYIGNGDDADLRQWAKGKLPQFREALSVAERLS